MRAILAVIALAWSTSGMTAQCGEPGAKKWNTVVKLKAATVTLHWTGVYEAPPAVCRIAYQTISGTVRTLDVWGHPDPNKVKSQIAFVSCRDDGCSPNIVVADITRGVVLKTALPLNDPQYYVKTEWQDSDHSLRIKVERFQSDPQQPRKYRQYFHCSIGLAIKCKRSG